MEGGLREYLPVYGAGVWGCSDCVCVYSPPVVCPPFPVLKAFPPLFIKGLLLHTKTLHTLMGPRTATLGYALRDGSLDKTQKKSHPLGGFGTADLGRMCALWCENKIFQENIVPSVMMCICGGVLC